MPHYGYSTFASLYGPPPGQATRVGLVVLA